MKKLTTIAAVLLLAFTGHAASAEAGAEIPKQSWTFSGPFGTYDENQLQRGFRIFRDVCASCHSANLLAFRNLAEEGGPGFTEGQVKALAASFTISDPTVEGGSRPGIAADRWPAPMSAADAIAAWGVVQPDFSVIAKARATTPPVPWWITNYFTAYQEGGPDYIYGLLNGYHAAPADFELPDGKHYNSVFPGHAIGMDNPLNDDIMTGITYPDNPDTPENEAFAYSHDQATRDVSAFLMWVADPHMVSRKETGFVVIGFLFLFAGLMWFVKKRLWKGIEH